MYTCTFTPHALAPSRRATHCTTATRRATHRATRHLARSADFRVVSHSSPPFSPVSPAEEWQLRSFRRDAVCACIGCALRWLDGCGWRSWDASQKCRIVVKSQSLLNYDQSHSLHPHPYCRWTHGFGHHHVAGDGGCAVWLTGCWGVAALRRGGGGGGGWQPCGDWQEQAAEPAPGSEDRL
jgi:hypothetical protein